jgi:hypothetical protein
LQKDSKTLEARRAFGLLFTAVAIFVASATILTEIAFINRAPLYSYAFIWSASFGITFGAIWRKFRKSISFIRRRMKDSTQWPISAKVLNGICWASPFALIPMLPHFYQFLILLGIGLGNFSTYLLMRRYSSANNHEQMIVGLISLAAIPLAMGIDMSLLVSRQDVAVMLSRILISIAYGTAGMYALFAR